MDYYLAPLEGITTYIYRNTYHSIFPPMEKYFTPFLVPRPKKGFSSRERKDILPEHNGVLDRVKYGLGRMKGYADAYINRIGLKRYHFCVSDAPSHDRFDISTLERVFGERVLDYVRENIQAHGSTRSFTVATIYDLEIAEVVADLSEHAFCFFLQIENDDDVTGFWSRIYGRARVII